MDPAIQLLKFVVVGFCVLCLRLVYGRDLVLWFFFSTGFALILYWREREVFAKRNSVSDAVGGC